jgi:hypothetical protein
MAFAAFFPFAASRASRNVGGLGPGSGRALVWPNSCRDLHDGAAAGNHHADSGVFW